MPATTSADVPAATGARWWDRAINALVPAALVAAVISYAFPFGVVVGESRVADSGFSAFLAGFLGSSWEPYFAAFTLPLIAAFIGLTYQHRPGWIGSLIALICAVVGVTGLGSAYLWEKSPFAYGYFAAEAGFLIAAVAAAVRLIRLRRNRAMWDAKAEARHEPAMSASQELLARYRRT